MLKIRMQRVGRINMPAFRIVVTEHTAWPKTGKFVEKVGTYNPKTKTRTLDQERVKYWLSVGAKPSDTVHNMLVTIGVINAKKINILPAYKAPAAAEAPVGKPDVKAPADTPEESVGGEKAAEIAPAAEVAAAEV